MNTVTILKVFGTLSKKYDIPVYANKKTWEAMPEEMNKISDSNRKIINIDCEFYINDLKIIAFSIPHDAACPCGYNIFNSGKKISIATDVGHVSDKIMSYLENSSFALLEANYDPDILKIVKHYENSEGINPHLVNPIYLKKTEAEEKAGL